jgi:hypothetical protein
MARDHQHNPEPKVNAARIVSESTRGEDQLPAEIEAAWDAWSAHIQNVDRELNVNRYRRPKNLT